MPFSVQSVNPNAGFLFLFLQPLSDATHFGFEAVRKVLKDAGGQIMVRTNSSFH